MAMNKRNRILKQMFDVRPTKRDGSLDMRRIEKVERIFTARRADCFVPDLIKSRTTRLRNTADIVSPRFIKKACERRMAIFREDRDEETAPKITRPNTIQLGQIVSDEQISVLGAPYNETTVDNQYGYLEKREQIASYESSREPFLKPVVPKLGSLRKDKSFEFIFGARKSKLRRRRKPRLGRFAALKNLPLAGLIRAFKSSRIRKSKTKGGFFKGLFFCKPLLGEEFSHAYSFAVVLMIFSLFAPTLILVQKGIETESNLLKTGKQALGYFAEAKDNVAKSQFDQAAVNFENSYDVLAEASQDLQQIGGSFSEILRFLPLVSKVATANYIIKAGENISLAGKYFTEAAGPLNSLGNPLESGVDKDQPSLTGIFISLRKGAENASEELEKAEENIAKVKVDDLPPEIRSQFIKLKQKLTLVNSSLGSFLNYSRIFLDVLGYNGQRKYLFLFQNNHEMRATGGFIGSYGILDISDGRVKKLFVDGIYNPDGQLKARVIPPKPIQKVSASWSMHDANWFPDFPASAEKISWFYEKTGGPTVDGIIALTPTVIQDLLEVAGPIEMPEYDTVIDKNNFIEKTQYEVEVDYDKELNRPKKFIADLTPKILNRVFNTKSLTKTVKVLSILKKALKEKHLLIYSKNYNIEKLLSEQGWSGEILNTDKDYLSVINTNINGYKTDAVIDETIKHTSEIQSDGSVIDTVSITRKHNGGNEDFEWYNKVNADYLRVYIPKGSKLIEASGQTREFNAPPLDCNSLGFKKDPQLQTLEDTLLIDEKSGTRVYEESNKTVLANWVYVSPGESVTLEYKYALPFKLTFDNIHHPVDSFSILYQKQSGSRGSKLISEIKLPQEYSVVWRYPDETNYRSGNLKMETILSTDKFLGIAVSDER